MIEWIPTANALLNLSSTVLIVAGLVLIKRGQPKLHQRCMVMAFGLSALFLVLYLIRYAFTGPTPYTGPARPFYLLVLWTHTPLAALTPVLVIITLWRALRGDFAHHRKIARVTVPIWLYVAVTGLIVYVLLHYVA
ncbi:MAG: DUF420 domain-containing protein [Candidatus Bipolaricaulota bacterium]|nr:DUF420 domain-containing protein [Candidatus Bipolaricaulota bacterium]MDW8031627.1 DUF420 domain-containing protein [Candidatus Bipolaricaulota bacterium]